MRCAWLLGCLLVLAGPAHAQEPAGQAAEAKPPKAERLPQPLVGRRLACRLAADAKGLTGYDRADEMGVCLAEARLVCLKEAVAAKKRGPDRKASIEECMAR